ncbi:MAG: hypothetical protein ABJA82_07860 [Myxococcales bacterium]
MAAIRPAAIVCELSPFLCLAAHGGPYPLLSVGHGFILPPPEAAAFPHLHDGPPAFAESRLLANANHAIEVRGRPPLAALPALLRGTAHAVTGLALLDPYRELRREPAVGPPALDCQLSAVAPSEDVFGYLIGEAPSTTPILQGWARSKAGGRVFVRWPNAEQRAIVAQSRIQWMEAPVPIQQALDQARLILHHGSMLLSEEALVAGRPQIVAPTYLEHLFTARALALSGLANIIRPGTGQNEVSATLSIAAGDEQWGARALAFGRSHCCV